MIASRQVEIPYNRGVGWQRGRGFGALAQVIGRTAIPFLRKYVVSAAKRISADMLELLPQRLERFLVVENCSKRLQRVRERKLWENNSEKEVAEVVNRGESFQQNLINNPVGRE